MPNLETLECTLFVVSSTLAGLSAPAVSIAYFMLNRISENSRSRAHRMITIGCIVGLVFVLDAFASFVTILWEAYTFAWLSYLIFVIGCVSLLILLLVLSGVIIKRKIPEFAGHSGKEKTN
jgi:MFS family permease